MKPVLAISLGDPAGIGPEITAAILGEISRLARPMVFGHWPTLERALSQMAPSLPVHLDKATWALEEDAISITHCGDLGSPIDEPGERSALAQLQALDRAIDFMLQKKAQALVTAPMSKTHVAAICPGFSGHTEHLAARAHLPTDAVTMIFSTARLAVGLVSTHLPLRSVALAITRPRLERTLVHLVEFLSRQNPEKKPRIALAALNPHAGEKGLLGDEEHQLLEPFCREQSAHPNLELFGPLPADVVFRDALNGKYDGVIAMYHDQAMIPIKLLGPGQAVNVTQGLPFIRTSPDHGVAYDIARKNKANPAGMISAAKLALRLSLALPMDG